MAAKINYRQILWKFYIHFLAIWPRNNIINKFYTNFKAHKFIFGLHGRKMAVHIGDAVSDLEDAPGGAPQGSVLGSLLFCLTTDRLALSGRGNVTPDFQNNGESISGSEVGSDSEDGVPVSPISPPLGEHQWWQVREESSDDEEIWLGPRRPGQRLLDTTVHSTLPSASFVEDQLGLPQWRRQPPVIMAYIDDYNVVEKIRANSAVGHFSTGKTTFQVRAPQSQEAFVEVKDESSKLGMVVNDSKTQLLCVSQKGNVLRSFITTPDGQKLESGDSLTILGFTFGPKPDVSMNTEVVKKKFATNLWALRFLKSSGMQQNDLLFTYKTIVRPALEFAAASYDSLLTAEQSESLEGLQARAMKVVFGETVSYRTVIEAGKIGTLKARRKELVKKLAIKTAKNERFSDKWFPRNPNITHNLRRREKYLIPKFRTERAKNSPIIAMRRILNDIER